jgi:hypothetical protein
MSAISFAQRLRVSILRQNPGLGFGILELCNSTPYECDINNLSRKNKKRVTVVVLDNVRKVGPDRTGSTGHHSYCYRNDSSEAHRQQGRGQPTLSWRIAEL